MMRFKEHPAQVMSEKANRSIVQLDLLQRQQQQRRSISSEVMQIWVQIPTKPLGQVAFFLP